MKQKTSIQNNKDAEKYDLLKVPDEVIIKQLRFDLGVANSEIAELKDEIKRLKNTYNSDDDSITMLSKMTNQINSLKANLKAFTEGTTYQKLQENIKKKDKQIASLRKTVSELLCKQNFQK